MSKVHVKTGDTVVILSGKDRGKKGKIMAVSPKEGKVIVENANIVSKHVKPRKMGEAGGIIKAESAIYACKVQVVCPRCGKPTRVTHKVLEDGTKMCIRDSMECIKFGTIYDIKRENTESSRNSSKWICKNIQY